LLKAIHAQGSREATLDKTNRVVEHLKETNPHKTAELVEDRIAGALSYYAYPWLTD
jgi:hypothetical protein